MVSLPLRVRHLDKQYKDKEWLYNKYINEKLSTGQIGNICGVDISTIRDWLVKYNIPRRSNAEAQHLIRGNHCNLSQEAIEWINGELLGDGSLYSHHTCSASFRYTSKHKEYIQYVSDMLKSFGIEQVGKITKYYDKINKKYSYRYGSRSYIELIPIYKEWYPERGKKIVPKGIVLTPLVCRQWYIGDGSLSKPKKCRPYIRLATCGFLISDVNWLVEKLYKLGFKVFRNLYDNVIQISTYSTKEFLNYVGKCPVECYQYKFSY